MTVFVPLLVAVLSIWDYPARQPAHERLRDEFVRGLQSAAKGDYSRMTSAARQGVALLPEDPTWRFNLACALAHGPDHDAALDTLEKAIDLGFRDPKAIAGDADLRPLAKLQRFKDLVEYAEDVKDRPVVLNNPLYSVPAYGTFGQPVTLGEQNVSWDFDRGAFLARVELTGGAGANAGDLYFNLDGGHSQPVVTNWPGLTPVRLDRDAREHGIGLDYPNMLFPYPVFGNCSRAMTVGPWWRSLPRAMVTTEARRLRLMSELYHSNQFWVYPAVFDFPGPGTNGDVFASVTPYWLTTQGRSWSDQYYLRAALRVSRSLKPEVKRAIVTKGLLAPTIQTLLRRSLRDVKEDEDYLTPKAHPTAFPPNGLDLPRLEAAAAALTVETVPPAALIAGVTTPPVDPAPLWPELTYISPHAWAYVLRAEQPKRVFFVKAVGGSEYAFAAVHDEKGLATVEKVSPDTAKVVIDRTGLTVTNRIDVAVFAKSPTSSWGAPSFVSFAIVDPKAEYSDPALTPPEELPPETGKAEGK